MFRKYFFTFHLTEVRLRPLFRSTPSLRSNLIFESSGSLSFSVPNILDRFSLGLFLALPGAQEMQMFVRSSDEKCFRAHNIHLSLSLRSVSGQSQVALRGLSSYFI